jgi:hypothetical protein
MGRDLGKEKGFQMLEEVIKYFTRKYGLRKGG